MEAPRRRVLVIGGGYVGLVTAVGLARLGHRVRLIETSPTRLTSLRDGVAPIREPGLDESLADGIGSGAIEVAGALAADDDAELILVCVGTPIGPDGRSDLSQLRGALETAAATLPGTPVVIRSTLAPGGTAIAVGWAGGSTRSLVTNPEFLRQGSAIADFLAPSRIVVGRFADADPRLVDMVVGLYDRLDAPVLVVDPPAAELIKNGSNAFLAMKLSFANEMAALSEAYGTDVAQVLAGITADPRIGTTYMGPSFGFGGSCLPKELRALEAAGRDRGIQLHVATAAADANGAQQERFAARIAADLGGVAGRRIGLLGLAFKAGTDDIRESPAVALAGRLLADGADVVAYDPDASPNAKSALPGLTIATTGEAVADGADAIVIATEWPQFRDLDWAAMARAVRGLIVFDGRRLLDPAAIRAAGFRYEAVGSAAVPATTATAAADPATPLATAGAAVRRE
jgi:UDPglucose 6-dehydrogenase